MLANRHAHGILYVRTSAGSSTMRNHTRNDKYRFYPQTIAKILAMAEAHKEIYPILRMVTTFHVDPDLEKPAVLDPSPPEGPRIESQTSNIAPKKGDFLAIYCHTSPKKVHSRIALRICNRIFSEHFTNRLFCFS